MRLLTYTPHVEVYAFCMWVLILMSDLIMGGIIYPTNNTRIDYNNDYDTMLKGEF